MSDDARQYRPLSRHGYRHHDVINHSARIYVDGDVHTNTIEGFWSLLKNGIRGVHHMVGTPYLQSYVDEYVFRYNHRDQTGEGQVIEWTLLRTALTISNGALMEQDLLQNDRVGSLNRAQTAGPSDVFQTKDGWVMCQVLGPSQFERWTEMVGRPDLLFDGRFKDDLARGDNGEILSAIMAAWCSTRTYTEALAAMEESKVPGGPVYSPQQALDDPHINATNIMTDVDHHTLSQPARVVDFPVAMSTTPGQIRRRAPELGEHTAEVLTELGYEASQIADLRAKRVV